MDSQDLFNHSSYLLCCGPGFADGSDMKSDYLEKWRDVVNMS